MGHLDSVPRKKKGSNVCCPFLSSFFLVRCLYLCHSIHFFSSVLPEIKTNTPGMEKLVYKYRKKGYPLAVHEEGQTEAK